MKPIYLIRDVILFIMLYLTFSNISVCANTNSLNQNGQVRVEGERVSKPVDPENPDKVVDLGVTHFTEGVLRIDYVSNLDFGESKISNRTRKYNALAQQFFDETPARASYIQITDQQANSSGWTLQVRQEKQFNNPIIQKKEERELKGAFLSLDKGWANSSGDSEAPTVSRETIALNAIGTSYEVATARSGSGKGIWTISFGSSKTNKNNQNYTLKPTLDNLGRPIIDKVYKKPVYNNSAITLTIPDTTIIKPVEYQTEITWILAKLP